jgi:aminoglycoside phosphotransferase (APT) family kinase protein
MEFVLGWLRRHPLSPSDREAPIVWDSGQFHHENGHLVAMVDLELGHIGDPMMDLAAWRMRDTVIPYGDFSALYDRYAELTGKPVDLAAIRWHHLFFTLTNQLSFHGALARPVLDTDYMTYAQWVSETGRVRGDARKLRPGR